MYVCAGGALPCDMFKHTWSCMKSEKLGGKGEDFRNIRSGGGDTHLAKPISTVADVSCSGSICDTKHLALSAIAYNESIFEGI